MRFEDTPELFGDGSGRSTTQELICQGCQKVYPDTGCAGKSTRWTIFAGLQIAECCFEKVESEVWSRREEILPWLRRILESVKKRNASNMESLDAIAKLRKEGS